MLLVKLSTLLVVYPDPPRTPIRHWLNISHHTIDFFFFSLRLSLNVFVFNIYKKNFQENEPKSKLPVAIGGSR